MFVYINLDGEPRISNDSLKKKGSLFYQPKFNFEVMGRSLLGARRGFVSIWRMY
jgi:hypothetical protein